MATEKQFEFFKYLYTLEDQRFNELVNRGKVFTSIITLYLGLLFFKASEALSLAREFNEVTLISYFGSIVLLVISLALSVLSLAIFQYEASTTPEAIIESFSDLPPSDEDFFDDRIVDFTVATPRNSEKNNRRARLLLWSNVFLFIGIISHLIFYLSIHFSKL